MRITRRMLAGAVLAVILSLSIVLPVLAVAYPYVTGFSAIPTDITMSLKWVRADGYNYTVIQCSSAGYPATEADGTRIYSAMGNSYMQEYEDPFADPDLLVPLTPGTTYYYSAWGYNGATYTAQVTHVQMTTHAGLNAGGTLPAAPFTTPNEPSSSGWFVGLQPFSGFVQGFEQAWGMKTDTMPFSIGIIILLVTGIGLYIVTKSPLLAIVGDFAIDLGLMGLGLLSPYTVAVVIAFGLGVWGLENIWI